ncbi:MAG: carboxypeptidase-like regulatory domain-containing protein [Planctomycetota bacterium]
MRAVLLVAVVFLSVALFWLLGDDGTGERSDGGRAAPPREPASGAAGQSDLAHDPKYLTGRLFGLVRGKNGPLWGIEIRAASHGETWTASTGAEGAYELEVPANRPLRVQALPGGETGLDAQSVSDVTVGVEQQRRLDFAFGGAAPADGKPPVRKSTVWGVVPPDARVAMALHGSEIMRNATMAGPDGSYRIDLKVAERTTFFLVVEVTDAVRGRLHKKRRSFKFELDPGEKLQLNPDLTLRDSVEGVIDPPTAGILVSAIPAESEVSLIPGGGRTLTERDWPERSLGMDVFEGRTDADGRFRIAVPKKQDYTLLSFQPDAILTPQTGEAGTQFLLKYTPSYGYEFRVSAADNWQPVPSFLVQFEAYIREWNKNEAGTEFVLSKNLKIDRGGRRCRDGRGRIRCRVPADDQSVQPVITGTIKAPGFQSRKIRNHAVILLMRSPAPDPNLTVNVQSASGEAYAGTVELWADLPFRATVPTTAAGPGVAQTRLGAGTWRLTPRFPGTIGIRLDPLDLMLSATPQTHRVTLPPGAPLHIENHTGRTIRLSFRRPGASDRTEFWNESVVSTQFEIPYIAAGEWEVRIVGGPDEPSRLHVVDGARKTLRFP